MGGNGAGNQAGLLREQRREVFEVQIVVVAHLPPDDFGAFALKLQPGGDIGFVVEFGDDDLVAGPERAADRETEQAKERRGVHAEGNLVGVACVDEAATLSRARAMDASTSMLLA
jgi:hypothetical protein